MHNIMLWPFPTREALLLYPRRDGKRTSEQETTLEAGDKAFLPRLPR